MPRSSEICWQEMPLSSASKTVGKEGGLSPRKRSVSVCSLWSCLANW